MAVQNDPIQQQSSITSVASYNTKSIVVNKFTMSYLL